MKRSPPGVDLMNNLTDKQANKEVCAESIDG